MWPSLIFMAHMLCNSSQLWVQVFAAISMFAPICAHAQATQSRSTTPFPATDKPSQVKPSAPPTYADEGPRAQTVYVVPETSRRRLSDLSFRRRADITLTVGFPEALGVCIESHLPRRFVLGACGGATLMGWSAGLRFGRFRAFHVVQVAEHRIRAWSIGFSGGTHLMDMGYDHYLQNQHEKPSYLISGELFGSLEYCIFHRTKSSTIGFTLQGDLGLLLLGDFAGGVEVQPIPFVQLSSGVAF